jgi:hypothetical protein
MVVHGGVWWVTVVYGGEWWCMAVYGGVWCFTFYPNTIFCTAHQVLLKIHGCWTFSSGFEQDWVLEFFYHELLTFNPEVFMFTISAFS